MNKYTKQSGQTLLIIIFAITLGLVALVGVSTRIVNSTRRVFIDNAYYKAQAVAEAGAEKFLQKSNADLKTLVDNNTCNPSVLYTASGFATTIPASCTLDTADGFTESRAVVAVEAYPTTNVYEIDSPANSTVSINLIGATGNIQVCWQAGGTAGAEYSEVLVFYYFKNSSGSYKLTQQKYVPSSSVSWYGHKPAGSWTSSGVDVNPIGGDASYACFTVPIGASDTAQLLNLMSLVNGSSYKITFINTAPTNGQGYKITSVGEVKSGATGGGSLASSTATRKKVVVEKSRTPNLGPWFNFAVASESGKIVAE